MVEILKGTSSFFDQNGAIICDVDWGYSRKCSEWPYSSFCGHPERWNRPIDTNPIPRGVTPPLIHSQKNFGINVLVKYTFLSLTMIQKFEIVFNESNWFSLINLLFFWQCIDENVWKVKVKMITLTRNFILKSLTFRYYVCFHFRFQAEWKDCWDFWWLKHR